MCICLFPLEDRWRRGSFPPADGVRRGRRRSSGSACRCPSLRHWWRAADNTAAPLKTAGCDAAHESAENDPNAAQRENVRRMHVIGASGAARRAPGPAEVMTRHGVGGTRPAGLGVKTAADLRTAHRHSFSRFLIAELVFTPLSHLFTPRINYLVSRRR